MVMKMMSVMGGTDRGFKWVRTTTLTLAILALSLAANAQDNQNPDQPAVRPEESKNAQI